MAYMMFVDESGHDRRESPYEVLAGIAVKDQDVWNLIDSLNRLEERLFGIRYSKQIGEIKGKRFLKRKVFRHASSFPSFPIETRLDLARQCLVNGSSATPEQLSALAQAKIDYIGEALTLCARFRCNVFASIVNKHAPRDSHDVLRKDYAYLFERFFYFLEDHGSDTQGIVVFDELEKSKCHILLQQMEEYFLRTTKGQLRSKNIIPEPFFVHSELTSMIQIADIIAYIVSWAFRLGRMTEPRRAEFDEYIDLLVPMRYLARREIDGDPRFEIWSFTYIDDLRGGINRAGT